jgi:hypothetical protein
MMPDLPQPTLPSPTRHLDEDERQSAADGSLAVERAVAVNEHLAACSECAADVARLRTLMTRIHDAPAPALAGDDLWPSIRSRIEQSKVVPLAPSSTSSPRRLLPARHRAWIAAGLAAAVIVAVAVPRVRSREGSDTTPSSSLPSLTPIVDSARAYEEEANTLLNELEMQRSLLPPQTAATVERDLRTIDQAIAELKEALVRDPNNPALRRLLASSYRQKVELLKRANHAG